MDSFDLKKIRLIRVPRGNSKNGPIKMIIIWVGECSETSITGSAWFSKEIQKVGIIENFELGDKRTKAAEFWYFENFSSSSSFESA